MVDKLNEYNARRDFRKTREPKGEASPRRGEDLWFSIQKHDASALHYDLRLEWDGVLLSWAVPKGPSPKLGDKRLAQRTEDHPLDYGDFEGTIPEGEYGGGTVMLWDKGTWTPRGDVDEMLAAGNLKMDIAGERIRGGYALVRFKKGGDRAWLLIKEKDQYVEGDSDALTGEYLTSVQTGRDMDAIAQDADAEELATDGPDRDLKAPKFQKPQLATLVGDAPEGGDWVHETKFDGYRALASVGKGGVTLWTRNGKDWTEKFGALAGAFDPLPCDACLLDGEVMAAKISGSPFSSLQRALKEGGDLVFFCFDLLSLDGEDLTGESQKDRRDALEKLFRGVPKTGPLRLTDQVVGHGDEVYAAACKEGAEGIISKKLSAPYRSTRSKAWVKVKCTKRQEFVVGGYAPSDKNRSFASLLVGEHGPDGLRYRGRVGTGYSQDDMQALAKGFIARKTPPFRDVPKNIARDAVWVRADTVIEVEFTEFTADGHIRHGAYQGTREDKAAENVTLETPQDEAPEPPDKTPEPKARRDGAAEVAGQRISSPDREVFPSSGCTKLDLARHYDRAGERLTAIAGHRPLSLLRAPKGMSGQTFFQKHASDGFPDAVEEVEIEEKNGGTGTYIYATRPEGFVACAQMGTIEFHIWGSRTDRIDRPDRLIFDLDPDEGLGWADTRSAAFDLRDRLEDLGLSAGAMVTGGKGVHVWVPLRRAHGWDTVKGFSKTLAHVMAEAEPDRFVATMSKARRKGRIFIDYLRNERGQTAVSPYSVRARQGGPVAVPVEWAELKRLDGANLFTMGAVKERLEEPCPYLTRADDLQQITRGTLSKLEDWAAADD
ncbi:ATP-dependent DNA ligase LigD phosphoesterase module /ATP-dependent DNA ligase LigD polymerase module [Palleronia marisminoris]|uniref:DNA ligase (ATP) n=1 Tax=Palleronia marisminoris TaxID=315423 RepID=A0A1Y5SJH0_9RHOB|nr:DNA ligase D [Palleronia marisminoris]SFG82414.1 ATP-dependent DNA ligase LigD phosphoesterase module /ATP-dependent DNA ligase LigD polymerase module [Palleronia marisminoris]SLN40528.1 Putative DNA ligase-like protein/MT0965 [Palleronia marisminoris]